MTVGFAPRLIVVSPHLFAMFTTKKAGFAGALFDIKKPAVF
jgi:hypothetical protein